jgi:dipeptidyl aminopeptidase/acylaminoacyl peptidase
LPLVVLPHDGPQGHNRLGFDWLAQALASRGYLVLQPDYRGSDGHGPDFIAAGYGQWGRKMQSDLSDGVRELVAQGMADPKRVCIIGFGYGGYAALNGAADPSTYRCAAAINGISDLAAYKTWQEGERSTPEQDAITPLIPDPDWPRAFKVNPDSALMLAAYLGSGAASPVARASAAAIPVLLIHESDDPVVPIAQGHAMRDALQSAGRSVDWVEVKGKDHTAATEDERAAILQAVADFLAKYNPAS